MLLHDLRGSQARLHSMPLLAEGDAPTATGLQDVLPLASLCLPLEPGKEALTAGLEQLAVHAGAASSAAVHDFGAALQVRFTARLSSRCELLSDRTHQAAHTVARDAALRRTGCTAIRGRHPARGSQAGAAGCWPF